MKEYTEGITRDGVAILEDGIPITITEILRLLNQKNKTILIEFENYRYKQITGMEPDKKYTEIIVSNYLNNI